MTSREVHIERIRDAVASGEASRSVLAASWGRCISLYGLDPANAASARVLNHAELDMAREASAKLLYVGRPVVDRLRLLAGAGVCLLWADADGVPLQSWASDADAGDLRRLGLWPGVDWSERSEGTNGIGTCLVEKRPIVIRHDQHFFPREARITCLVAPIFDHMGVLRGALNATIYGGNQEPGWVELLFAAICDAAQEIETEYFHHAFEGSRILSIGGRRGAALIAVDHDEILLGASRTARATLGVNDILIKDGCCVTDLFETDPDDLTGAERGVLRRALTRHRGNVTAAARTLDISLATMKRKMQQHRLHRKM
ncbi:sigma-54-dependent Fis family transcriptional regulator [Rhizobium wenxiniae]|uniref:GAF domain-containing protein n=1 Tax=Rhizobium wenxiniae TaxID=1737357 RepID=UPI001C6EA83B|nr:GAF domain-containing protein [Rhizobium wenxiniae]MBW9089541.1 sigma-54-dependent Fis family transcriptional regulator [Rhizobium wenxiniae]